MSETDRHVGAALTRRRLVMGGIAGFGSVVAVGLGQYAIGDEFEQHVAGVLGVSTPAAAALLSGARERLGDAHYNLHAAAFLAVTTSPADTVLPTGAQRRAIERFVGNLVANHTDQLIALGLQRRLSGPCRGLLVT